MADVLTIDNLTIGFRNGKQVARILKGVSFSVPQGKTVALVGESGSGKSTIGSAIMGLLPTPKTEQSGRIVFREPGAAREIDISKPTSREYAWLRGNRITLAFQEPSAALSPVVSVGAMLSETLSAHQKLSTSAARQRVLEILRRVGFPDPEGAYTRYPFELSGGLRQRAMLASALVSKPALVIADEPTSALDVTVQALALKLLADLQDEMGLSLLFITHDFGVVANVADHVIVLREGQIVEQGTTHEVLTQPKSDYARALLAAVPRLEGEPFVLNPPHASSGSIQTLGPVWASRIGPPAGTPLIEVNDAGKRFTARKRSSSEDGGTVEAVLGVDLTINAGECVGLVGESGCGKSTLSKMIMRALTPDSGTIRINDGKGMVSVAGLSGEALKQYRARVQYVFQDPFASLNPRRTAEEIVTEPFAIHGLGTPAQRLRWAAALFEMVGLDRMMLMRHPNAFSGGQRQRIGIARALALGPDLLVCDEPVSALDVSVQAQILGLLDGLRQDLGVASLFVSHNLAVVRAIAAKVYVMCRGRIVEAAPVAELFANPRHPYTKALLAANPEPDPERKLDLGALMHGRASDPAAWPEPYRLTRGQKPRYETVGEGHIVAVA
ncbi:MAG: ABC transporter ATP-binding protein [Alphaproteobacteria bacterium]|nr:ABC transporter ATP-binding protein [Alphaproteobacteria bacterium]